MVCEIAIKMPHVVVLWFYCGPGIWRFPAVLEIYANLPTIEPYWQNEDVLPLDLVEDEGNASRGCIVDVWTSRVLGVHHSRSKKG